MSDERLVCSAFDDCKALECIHKRPHDRDESCEKTCGRNPQAECLDFMFRKDPQTAGLRAAGCDGFEEPTL